MRCQGMGLQDALRGEHRCPHDMYFILWCTSSWPGRAWPGPRRMLAKQHPASTQPVACMSAGHVHTAPYDKHHPCQGVPVRRAFHLNMCLIFSTCSRLQIAPAMNTAMWEHPLTARQLEVLSDLGVHMVPPISKKLACGDMGTGALAAPEDIARAVQERLHPTPQNF